MTKSTITRERLEQLANFKGAPVTRQEGQELARMALAAMDSEPVAWRWRSGPDKRWHLASRGDLAGEVEPLYRHAQPVLEIESEPVFTLEVARADYKGQELGNHFGFITLEAARELKEGNYQLYTAQPAPVVPEEATPDSIEILASARRRDHAVFQWDEDQRNAAADSWNACRAAMLAAAPQEVNHG
ncbi:hypothetical protein AAHW98_09840 [Klebsiella variicola subsp. variicola]